MFLNFINDYTKNFFIIAQSNRPFNRETPVSGIKAWWKSGYHNPVRVKKNK